MNKDDAEQCLERIDEIVYEVYVKQMVRNGKAFTKSEHDEIRKLINQLFKFIDGIE